MALHQRKRGETVAQERARLKPRPRKAQVKKRGRKK